MVYCLTDRLALVQTVDFFTPVVDDPYLFGAISAANSLSDIYAMGGRPILALNIVAFPRNNVEAPLSMLREILRGGADKAGEAGIDIVGGHSIDDPEPKYGLVVSGLVHPRRAWRNDTGHAGDVLVLTKPLGTGIITTALRSDRARAEDVEAAIGVMAALNRGAAEAALEVEIHACTDITGFGFLWHLREMLGEGGIGARIRVADVPILAGARELAAEGVVPGGTYRNRQAIEGILNVEDGVSEDDQIILSDAQTSGGLLLAVAPDDCDRLVEALQARNVPIAAVVGELFADRAGRIMVSP